MNVYKIFSGLFHMEENATKTIVHCNMVKINILKPAANHCQVAQGVKVFFYVKHVPFQFITFNGK